MTSLHLPFDRSKQRHLQSVAIALGVLVATAVAQGRRSQRFRRRRSSSATRWAPIASLPTGTSCSRCQVLGKASNKMRLVELGKTSEGRPTVAIFISSPANLGKLDHYKQINARLTDPQGLSEPEARKLATEQGRHHSVVRAALERSGRLADGG